MTKESLDEIFYLLKNSDLTIADIAKKTNTSKKIISEINCGKHYINNLYDYPIRKERIKQLGVENKTSKFYNNEQLLYDLINDLKYSDIPQKELVNKYNVSISVIGKINRGVQYRQDNETYPLRDRNKFSCHKKELNEQQLNEINNLLRNTNKSMTVIGKYYNLSRDYIGKINSGQKYFHKEWEYPLR